MGKKLVDRLKLVLGRQLSPKKMANARKESEEFEAWLRSDPSKKIDDLEKRNSGEFVRFRQRFQYMTTPDASHGWEQPHTGYYPSKTIKEIYDSKGRLKEKTVAGCAYNWEGSTTRLFNPPGRLIGKKEKI